MPVEGLVSTIIPVYNRPVLVREAVESVLVQTYRPIEIIVVDDGSTDGTPAAVEAMLGTHPEITLLRQPNSGPGPARQKGIDAASGQFIQFLDSDDLLLQDKFRLQVSALRSDKAAGVCYGKTRYRLPSGEVLAPWLRTGERIRWMFPAMLAGRWWGTSTPLYRRALLDSAGSIVSLINEEDWEFDCRIAAHGVQLAWVDQWVSEERSIATQRASADGSSDPRKLTDRARARHLILASALRAGIPPSAPEFQAFISSSFLLARQCADVGLVSEAEELVKGLCSVAPRRLMKFYLLAGKWLGFQRATRAAEHAHRVLRQKRPASET